MKKKETDLTDRQDQSDDLEGYPLYPDNEDIYNRFKEETDIDPEDIQHRKTPVATDDEFVDEEDDLLEEEDLIHEDQLDIPGAELDDEDEAIGNEDEENNYYSIGGDKHHDLEEDAPEII